MSLTILVTASLANPAPFPGTWETQAIGYVSTDAALTGAMGTISSNQIFGNVIESVDLASSNSVLPAFNNANGSFLLLMQAGSAANLFQQITVNRGGIFSTYTQLAATLLPTGTQIGSGGPIIDGPAYVWPAPATPIFASGLITTLTITAPLTVPTAPSGNGDITDPEAWQDSAGNIPPLAFSQVPYNINYPLNGDGRYWFQANAANPISTYSPISFIGSSAYASTGTMALQCSIVQAANDGSVPQIAYATSGGTWTTVGLIGSTGQLAGIQNGQILVPLN